MPIVSPVSVAAEDTLSIQYSAEAPGPGGHVACHVLRSHSTRDGRTRYTIVVRNDTAAEISAVTLVPEATDVRSRTIMQATIASYSDFSIAVELETARYGGTPDVHIDLRGDGVDFVLIVPRAHPAPLDRRIAIDAPAVTPTAIALLPDVVPQRPSVAEQAGSIAVPRANSPRARVAQQPSALPMLALFAAVMTIAGGYLLRPHIDLLRAPETARAGETISVAYRATGLAAVAYDVFGPDARSVARGALTNGSGTFGVDLPKDRSARAYLVHLRVDGVFDSQSAEAYVKLPDATLETPAPRAARRIEPPEIRSLAIDRAVATSGDELNVFYDVLATGGSVALIDPGAQITYGRSNLLASGRSTFALPRVDTERPLNVVVTARRGPNTIQARVALSVRPQPSPSPLQSPEPPSDDVASGTPSIVVPARSVAGRRIVVAVEGMESAVALVLVDRDGVIISRRDLPPEQHTAAFVAPAVRVLTRYEIRATYSYGVSSEMIVRPITVTPA